MDKVYKTIIEHVRRILRLLWRFLVYKEKIVNKLFCLCPKLKLKKFFQKIFPYYNYDLLRKNYYNSYLYLYVILFLIYIIRVTDKFSKVTDKFWKVTNKFWKVTDRFSRWQINFERWQISTERWQINFENSVINKFLWKTLLITNNLWKTSMIITRYEIKKQNMCSYILTNKQLDLDEKIKSHIDIY